MQRLRSRRTIAVAGLFLVIGLGTGALVVLWARDDATGSPPVACSPDRQQDCQITPGLTAEETLARKYAPIVQLREQRAPCDRSGAGFEPLPVDVVLGNNDVLLRTSDGATMPAPTAADLYELDDAYLDFPGDPRRPGCGYERDGRRIGEGHARVVYARIAQDPEHTRLALQYWFFYYFNDWSNKHEGDWEMIQLTFEAESAQQSLALTPETIAMSQHSGGEIRDWEDNKVTRDGHRPVIFVAVGSQAGFFAPHIYLGRGEEGTGFGCDDASEPGRRLPLQPRLLPQQIDGPADPYAWITFRGRWGQLAGGEFNGPTGPNMKRPWSEPFAWEDDLRSSSVRIPSREFVGPNSVSAFCGVVAFVSDRALPIILQAPRIAAGAGVLFVVAALGSLTRTRYLPLGTRPLRARRRFGQILLVGANVYRRHARVFLGIGCTFIPVALAVSLLEWLLFAVTPVGSVINLEASNAGERAILALAFGAAEFGAAYALVIAASIAALSTVEKDERPSIRGAWRVVLGELLHLAPARGFAVAAISLLTFTIVGLPFAVRYAVRWGFIEHAVLLDRRRGLGALTQSSSVAGNDWWCAVASVAGLGALGLGAAPVAGAVLLLAVPALSLTAVNLVAAIVYLLLVPYVGVASTLVYFDLQSRAMAGDQ